MSTPFQRAALRFVNAAIEADEVITAAGREEAEQELAEAGDVLEREMRQMMREEAANADA